MQVQGVRRGTACLRQSAKRYHAPCRTPQTIERAGADPARFAFAAHSPAVIPSPEGVGCVRVYFVASGAGSRAALSLSNFSCAAAATRFAADSIEIERWLMTRS